MWLYKLPHFKVCERYQSIVRILSTMLFNGNPDDVFTKRYEQMIAHCDTEHSMWPRYCSTFPVLTSSKDVLLNVPVSKFPGLPNSTASMDYLGHDLPFWFDVNANEEKGRIMLIAQDPLRANKSKGYITFSTPFGMHSVDYRGNRLFTQVVERLVSQGYSVYITDAYKLYGKKNDVKQSSPKLDSLFVDVLLGEIGFFKPSTLVALGKKAERFLKRNISFSGTVKNIPHPNARISNVFLRLAGAKNKEEFFINSIIP